MFCWIAEENIHRLGLAHSSYACNFYPKAMGMRHQSQKEKAEKS